MLSGCCQSHVRRKLTELIAKSATVTNDKRQFILWDSEVGGFDLRCLAGGAKTWIYVYRPEGGGRGISSQTLKLGSWPNVSVDDARKAARVFAGTVAHGRDPAAERREERRRQKATLQTALDDYERSLRQRRIVNVRTVMSALRRGLSRLTRNDVRTLTRADYVAAIASGFAPTSLDTCRAAGGCGARSCFVRPRDQECVGCHQKPRFFW